VRPKVEKIVRKAPVRQLVSYPKVGRNDRCPCGSGEKFKRCCMRRDQRFEWD